LGRVRKVETAKCQNLTSQVEKTAVEKCEGMTLKRMMRTICGGVNYTLEGL
jgi:hypothetical protein